MPTNAELENERLANLLGAGFQTGAARKAQEDQFTREQAQRAKDLATAQDIIAQQAGKGRKINVRLGDKSVDLSQSESFPDPRVENQIERMAAKYSDHIQKAVPFDATLQEIENLTNRDGKGGILTNPQAELISTGKTLSAVPTKVLGLAELSGIAPKGVSDERKALERLNITYQNSVGGLRQSKERLEACLLYTSPSPRDA